jgi:hypothetical protein
MRPTGGYAGLCSPNCLLVNERAAECPADAMGGPGARSTAVSRGEMDWVLTFNTRMNFTDDPWNQLIDQIQGVLDEWARPITPRLRKRRIARA